MDTGVDKGCTPCNESPLQMMQPVAKTTFERHGLFFMRTVCFGLFALKALLAIAAGADTNQLLRAVPEGYCLQAYDDCGVEGRQPHVLMKDCYLWTFQTSDTDAGLKERSAVFSAKSIQAIYTNLNPKLSYVLALTYANDHRSEEHTSELQSPM